MLPAENTEQFETLFGGNKSVEEFWNT